MQSRLWWISACLASTVLIVGCDNDPVDPTSSRALPSVEHALNADSRAEDPAMEMRRTLHGRSDDSVRAQVSRGANVVTIGFKPAEAPWGVNERGVMLVPPALKSEHTRAVEALATRVIYRYKNIPAVTVELPNPNIATQLRHLPWVDYVAPATSLLTPDWVDVQCFPTPSRGIAQGPQHMPWNVQRVGADQAWSITTGNSLAELLVLDDGVDEQQAGLPLGPELHAEVYLGYVGGTPYNGYHGTAVLGAAEARNNTVGTVGVAPDTKARIAKIADNGPNPTQDWDYWAAMAIDGNATLSGVVTISYSTKQTSSTPPASFVSLYDAIKNAYYQRNVAITASAGNQNRSDYYAYPAAYPEVIGVGGSGFSDEYVFNNYAPGNVDLAAPAVDVETVCKGGAIGLASGTSFATPMVAGALMLLRAAHPTESAAQLRQRLLSTAVPMADSRKSGAGRMDVYAALTYAFPPTVSIGGASYIDVSGAYTWTAHASGGDGTYSYQWQQSSNGSTYFNVGTGSTYTEFEDGNSTFYLRVNVTSNGQTASKTVRVTVNTTCEPGHRC